MAGSTDASQQAGFPKNIDTGNGLDTEESSNRSYLRGRFAAGNLVYASDLNTLRTVLNAFQRHYHRYTDYSNQHTYGNNGQGTTSGDKDTGLVPGYTDPGTVAGGAVISTTHVNAHKDAVNALRQHNHSIDDA